MADVALVLIAGSLLARPLRRLRQPVVIAEIAAGIALGPSLLGLLPGDLPQTLFPDAAREHLLAIAEVGLLVFMFLVGWEMEGGALRRRRGAVAAVSLSSMAVPFAMGFGLAAVLYSRHSEVNGEAVPRLSFLLFLGTALAITAFPVLARILVDHRMQSTPVGTLVLACAAVADALAWAVLAVVTAVVTADGPGGFLSMLAGLAVFMGLLVFVVRPCLARWMRGAAGPGRSGGALLTVVFSGLLLSGWATSWIGVDAIFGAFAFGLVTPREPREVLRRRLREPLERTGGLLLPVFFVVTGLSVDLGALGPSGALELLAIIAVACAGKFLGAGVPARLSGCSWAETRQVAVLMNTRGLTELVILKVGMDLGILDERIFTMMVVMALVTSMLAGPLLPRPGTDPPTGARVVPPAPAHDDRRAVS
ncbi:cation:proton antiporter domain-containing protein [Streptomyces marincola]|uniref:cation:proton antiporter domain-containing protein n=1 Tax=Streptomyces marincola TaxID=2878388 RepID=UPI001CF35AA7|nr:cation:proton antiporter [Streptomyces marincola]UCM90331.1 cation:proton antiporter [Streptomyces marincola]